MRLKSLWIDQYERLQNFEMPFKPIDSRFNSASLRLLIGRNGSGKSSLLEALGLIFTRAVHDEYPGFNYDLQYSVELNGEEINVWIKGDHTQPSGQRIQVRTKPQKELDAPLQSNDEWLVRLDWDNWETIKEMFFSRRKDLHPARIFAIASGPNNALDDVLLHSPKVSLLSDLYDALQKNEAKSTKTAETMSNLREFVAGDPRYLFIDHKSTAKLALIALAATLPAKSTEFLSNYVEKRQNLYEKIRNFHPTCFSLILNENKLQTILTNFERYESNPRIRNLLELAYGGVPGGKTEKLHHWAGLRTNGSDQERIIYFTIDNESEGELYFQTTTLKKWEPLELLTTLLAAKREGLLNDAHLGFRQEGCQDLLSEDALSDGEFLWLSRLGLILLAQGTEENNMLFLFDEPDVHLNESWTIEFVNLIHDFYRMSETERDSRLEHELLVATHSSMILTDVDCDQIYHFSNDITDSHVKVGPSSISPFGASRDEISKQIFGTDSSIGHYTLDVLQRFDKENLDDFIKKLGPGYLRFRLLDLQRNSSSE